MQTLYVTLPAANTAWYDRVIGTLTHYGFKTLQGIEHRGRQRVKLLVSYCTDDIGAALLEIHRVLPGCTLANEPAVLC